MLRILVSTTSIHLQQKLLHREFWIQLLVGRILPILIPLLSWQAVFDFTQASELGGWQRNQMEIYYLLVFFISLFADIHFHFEMSSMVHLGSLDQWLIRPPSFFLTITGIVLSRIFILLIPGFVALVIGTFFIQDFVSSFSAVNIFAAIFVVPLSLLIFSCLSVIIGMLSFWTIRTEGIFTLIMLFLEFFGGRLLPLSLLPTWLEKVSYFFPLRFAISLPIETIMRPSRHAIIAVAAGQFSWTIALFCCTILLWKFGIRRYDAAGG